MKGYTILVVFLMAGAVTMATPVREPGSPYDITAPLIEGGERGWDGWEEIYLDDVESLSLGPVDGQVNEHGQEWSSFDAVVDSDGANQFVSQTNTYADGYFFAEVGTTLPATDGPFAFSVYSELSDLATSRFYTPVDNLIGQIFTRVGDSDSDGFWEVLQLDDAGDPYFAETGEEIPLSFTLEVLVEGEDLEVLVDETSIFIGETINTEPFGGAGLSATLTGVYFESGNDFGGFGSVATYDDVGIAVPEGPTLLFMLVGAAMAIGLAAAKRFA